MDLKQFRKKAKEKGFHVYHVTEYETRQGNFEGYVIEYAKIIELDNNIPVKLSKKQKEVVDLITLDDLLNYLTNEKN